MKSFEPVKGFSFAPFVPAGRVNTDEAKKSLLLMKERTASDFVILVPMALQENCIAESIDFTSPATMKDEELIDMIRYAHSIGLRTAIKPTVNCKDGMWRGHIHFFDEDVPCEPKWSKWFPSYTEFQLHFAEIAEKEGCYMFIAGCEMVMADHRDKEWRQLISDIRKVYSGIVTYNCDKYQEHNVHWWDCVDVICSSGYYPIGKWEQELDRIEKVVKAFGKPFFFAETGCMSTVDSNTVPNDWSMRTGSDLKGQADWYEDMLSACDKRGWVGGEVFWSWGDKLYPLDKAEEDMHYEVYGKPAEEIVKRHFGKSTA